jgi:quinol monooxygenase YgiN
MRPGLTLIAYLHAKPEKRDELVALMHSWVAPTRSEAGCVDYHLHDCEEDPNLFVFYENWRTREDFEEHLEMPYLKSFWGRRLDFLTEDVKLEFFTMRSEIDTAQPV